MCLHIVRTCRTVGRQILCANVGKVEPYWVDKNHPCPVCALTNQHHGIIDSARADRKHLWNDALILHGFCIAPTRGWRNIRGIEYMSCRAAPHMLRDALLDHNMAAMSILEDASYINILALTILLLFSYSISTAVYRLYFHPLAKFPGPFWAKISTIPAWWHTKNQDRHLWLLSLQEQYGTQCPAISRVR